jgi:RHS repeat-associated protein
VNVKHKFTGQEWDAETDLYYYGARYYDPKLARFISADTIVPEPFYPQSLNRYAYCANNPVILRDLDGHDFSSWVSSGWNSFSNWASNAWDSFTSSFGSGGGSRNYSYNTNFNVDYSDWQSKNNSPSVLSYNSYSSNSTSSVGIGGGSGASMTSVIGGGGNLYAAYGNGTATDAGTYGSNESGAEAAYGETSGLYPQQATKGSIYNSKTWDNDSYQNLQDARSYIADVSGRNTYVRSYRPTGSNSFEQEVWNACNVAADNASNLSIPSDVNHFFIRQNGTGRQNPDWAGNLNPYKSFGPFINTGGGDVPKGNQTFIDFYRGIK